MAKKKRHILESNSSLRINLIGNEELPLLILEYWSLRDTVDEARESCDAGNSCRGGFVRIVPIRGRTGFYLIYNIVCDTK